MKTGTKTAASRNQDMPASSTQRLAPLDGLRAVAIAWVAIFHFFNFWAPSGKGDPILPYGDMMIWFPLANAGGLGVHLFFMVSGFVILMTLERTHVLTDFLIRRAARIFPTLILCGCLTWLIASAIGPESLQRNVWEFLFSIFAIPPGHVGLLLGQPDWVWLDGAYWSLWVELRFYATIGILYFVLRKNWVIGWFSFQVLGGLLALAVYFTGSYPLDRIGSLIYYEYAPLFSIGILAYLTYQRGGMKTWMKYALMGSLIHVTLLTLIFRGPSPLPISFVVGYILMMGLFYVALVPGMGQKILSWGPLVKVGRASYSYYLLHQVIGLSLLYWFGTFMPAWAVLVFVLPLVNVALVWASLIIFSRFEQPLNKAIVARFSAQQKSRRSKTSHSEVAPQA